MDKEGESTDKPKDTKDDQEESVNPEDENPNEHMTMIGQSIQKRNDPLKIPGRALNRKNLRVLNAVGFGIGEPRRLDSSGWEDLSELGSISRVLSLTTSNKISMKKIASQGFRRRARSDVGDSRAIKFRVFDSKSLGGDLPEKFSLSWSNCLGMS